MTLLQIIQIIISVVIVILILLQDRGGETSGIFGGAGGGGAYYQRRGIEKVVFVATIILTIIFIGLGILNLVLPNLQNLF